MSLLLTALVQFVATAWGVFAGMCAWGYFICRDYDVEVNKDEAESENETE